MISDGNMPGLYTPAYHDADSLSTRLAFALYSTIRHRVAHTVIRADVTMFCARSVVASGRVTDPDGCRYKKGVVSTDGTTQNSRYV